MDVEADDRRDVLVVDSRELARVLETLERGARADPAPADGDVVDVGEKAGLGAAADLGLQALAILRAVTVPVRVPTKVPELAPAAVRLRGSAVWPLPLEEIGDVVQRSRVAMWTLIEDSAM